MPAKSPPKKLVAVGSALPQGRVFAGFNALSPLANRSGKI
ncbi:Maltogenic amylase [Bacillus cereus AH1272]|nr:Maltogenic amylase [Bacillus cereus AH1272]